LVARDKVRVIAVYAVALRLIEEYLTMAGHADDSAGPVFCPVTNNRTGELDRPLHPNSVYRNIVQKYGLETGFCPETTKLRVPSLRATAATNALSHEADIVKVQEWLGHANVSTTRLCDRRKTRPEDSPTFRVRY
jgi:integrase